MWFCDIYYENLDFTNSVLFCGVQKLFCIWMRLRKILRCSVNHRKSSSLPWIQGRWFSAVIKDEFCMWLDQIMSHNVICFSVILCNSVVIYARFGNFMWFIFTSLIIKKKFFFQKTMYSLIVMWPITSKISYLLRLIVKLYYYLKFNYPNHHYH